MSLRYVGGLISPSVNPLAANVTTSPNVAQYNGSFTLQQQAQALTSGQWATDPYYKNTTLLLHADGKANGSQNNTFLDSSASPFTITRNGNTTQGSFTPYGPTWSNYFGGTADYVSASDSADFDFGAGNFTVECWFYFVSTESYGSIIGQWASANKAFKFGFTTTDALTFTYSTTGSNETDLAQTGTLSRNAWHHIVACRSGTGTNQFAIFVDGTRVYNGTLSATFYNSAAAMGVGGDATGSCVGGYISNARLVKGTSVYDPTSSTIAVPTAPLTSVTNTVLLTCSSNRFVDTNTATTAKTITVNGAPSVQRFSPFAPQYQYTPAVIGGSGYFDGTGDYLDVAYNSAFTFAGDFTVEGWFYPTHSSSGQFVWFGIGGDASGLVLTSDGGNTYAYFVGTGNVLSGAAIQFNAWQHVAIVRNGTGSNNITLYINGVSKATYTSNTTCNASHGVGVGYAVAGTSFTKFSGYISDFRVVKGTAVYTSAFTPSTSPLTAVSGTSLLTNMTNAGITDNAMMNNLETVGNAQVSTSVVKYGSGSLYFDGSSDWLAFKTTPEWSFGTGDFTVEMWVNLASTNTTYVLIGNGGYNSSASNVAGWSIQFNTGGTYFGFNAAGNSYWFISNNAAAIAATFPIGSWVHVAMVRQSGVLTCYINGKVLGSPTAVTDSCSTSSYTPKIGTDVSSSSGYYMNGYMDDVRITKGVARYTAPFTPPKVAFANQ